MDFLLFLNKDCSYRAQRVDAFLTVLWHPHEDKLVGIKLKGFKFLFEQYRAVVGGVDENHFISVIRMLELAMVGGVGEAMLDQLERSHRAQILYARAKEFVAQNDPTFDVDELKKAA